MDRNSQQFGTLYCEFNFLPLVALPQTILAGYQPNERYEIASYGRRASVGDAEIGLAPGWAHRVFRSRNQSRCRSLMRITKNRETAMRIAKIILAGTAAFVIISPAALAQQPLTGTLTQVDRIHGTVAIKQTQSGTTGANTGAAAEEFKAHDGLSLDALHAGDKVTFSVTETGGIKTITKLQKQ
jgi:Cu/Ag efflux protein CusF